MKGYDEKESFYLKYWDVNNLYGWAMSQKLPVSKFEWIEDTFQFNEVFIKNYNEESDEGYFLEADVQYPFLPERLEMQIAGKLVTNLHDETEYAIHLRNLKKA